MNRQVRTSKYHVVWIPKYRKRFLRGKIKYYVEKYLNVKAKELNIEIENLEIMPDHVHLFISLKPTQNIADIVKQLKGYSSHETRKILGLTRYKAFWGRGYFCESVGHISEQTIKKYIDNQWKHYSDSSPD